MANGLTGGLKRFVGWALDALRPPEKMALDASVLRQTRIEILTLDERWNNLFKTLAKTRSIIKAENAMNAILDERTRLESEFRNNRAEKQARLGQILGLSGEAFSEAGGEAAHEEVVACEVRVREINAREPEIGKRLDEITDEIRACNIALLESAVSHLYAGMKKSQARIAELNGIIEGEREKLKEHISERETLDASVIETYHFLHGLFGAEYIDPIDDHYADL